MHLFPVGIARAYLGCGVLQAADGTRDARIPRSISRSPFRHKLYRYWAWISAPDAAAAVRSSPITCWSAKWQAARCSATP